MTILPAQNPAHIPALLPVPCSHCDRIRIWRMEIISRDTVVAGHELRHQPFWNSQLAYAAQLVAFT